MCSVMMRVTVLRFCSLAAPICSFGLPPSPPTPKQTEYGSGRKERRAF